MATRLPLEVKDKGIGATAAMDGAVAVAARKKVAARLAIGHAAAADKRVIAANNAVRTANNKDRLGLAVSVLVNARFCQVSDFTDQGVPRAGSKLIDDVLRRCISTSETIRNAGVVRLRVHTSTKSSSQGGIHV